MRHLTVNEAAAALRVSVPTIKRYLYEGKLRSVKLPGGQHRIPQSEIDRLLSPEGGTLSQPSADEVSVGERVAVLERWATELQADLERVEATLEVISRYCARFDTTESEGDMKVPEESGHRVLVLGPGCRRCDALYRLAERVVSGLGRSDVSLERVTNLDDIAALGPILTPALMVDNELVISGRVPSESALRKMLERRLA